MRYSTIVEKDDKTLVEIIEALEQFERERFIAGIQARHNSLGDRCLSETTALRTQRAWHRVTRSLYIGLMVNLLAVLQVRTGFYILTPIFH